MGTQVPVARRNILAERRRLVVAVFGAGLAVALILLLEGLWSGLLTQISAYRRTWSLRLSRTCTRASWGRSSTSWS